MERINKPWGFEEILETNSFYTVKRLLMKAGHQCSYQLHREKTETVYCLDGILTIVMEIGDATLNSGDIMTILPLTKHRMRAALQDCLYLECSTSQLDDVVRFDDDYGREG